MTHDSVTTAGAAGAVSSPLWLPKLHDISVIASELLPILGAVWLVTQITIKIRAYMKQSKDTDV